MTMRARRPLLLLAGAVFAAPASLAHAAGPAAPAGLQIEGRRLVWQGELRQEHADEAARLIREKQVDGLELRNSPGAGKFAATIFSVVYKELRDHKLPTYARGICGSLCASLFLSGRTPTMLKSLTPGVPTVVMFHAVRYRGAVDPALTRTRIADIASVRGERARRLLLRVADEHLPLAAALYIFPRPVDVDTGSSAVLFCDGSPGQTIKQCAPLPGDPLRDLGVTNGL